MINEEQGCAAYLADYTSGEQRLAELMPAGADGYGRSVAVTLLLALGAAEHAEPVGLARPALALAAMCEPAGHPDTLRATDAVTTYLSAYRTTGTGEPVTTAQARKAMRLLHRYGLLTHNPADGARAVRIHALTARAMRESTTDADTAVVAHAVADALLQLWPTNGDHASTPQVTALRANTTTGRTGTRPWCSGANGQPCARCQSLHGLGVMVRRRAHGRVRRRGRWDRPEPVR
jgi:hypothetical protein